MSSSASAPRRMPATMRRRGSSSPPAPSNTSWCAPATRPRWARSTWRRRKEAPMLVRPGRLMGRGSIGAAFSPLSPFLWLDPSDLSTLFQDAGMTTPVTEDGDPVGAMLDKSGNDHHALQATEAFRPTYHTGG